MVKFLDGPAMGEELCLRNTPVYLRVVVDAKGEVDALDMPGDVPSSTEKVFAYKAVEGIMTAGFVCRIRGRGCIPFKSASYKLCENQPEESILRNRELWVKWVEG